MAAIGRNGLPALGVRSRAVTLAADTKTPTTMRASSFVLGERPLSGKLWGDGH